MSWSVNKFQKPPYLSRRDSSVFGRWWWSIDRTSLFLILMIIGLGIVLSFAASPAVAHRLNLETFYFVKRHSMMAFLSIIVIVFVSLCNLYQIRLISLFIYIIGIGLLILTLSSGVEIKGAKRWINIFGQSIQASEFLKPVCCVLSAWLFSLQYKKKNFPGFWASFLVVGMMVGLILLQPDLGMSFVFVSTWVAQLFVAGLPIVWIAFLSLISVSGVVGSYFFFPHVAKRINEFLESNSSSSSTNDLYQIKKSLNAFMNGGWFGKGPGEGVIKHHVPDAHADFIFAVAGEEFGFVGCIVIISLYTALVVRLLYHCFKSHNPFSILTTVGLSAQFGIQAFVNMASSLHLIPTKGMTLPFLSYGGSSMIALSIGMGMALALTRIRDSGGGVPQGNIIKIHQT